MTHELLGYIALFAPFVATCVITLFTLRAKALSGTIALTGIVVGFVATAILAVDVLPGDPKTTHYEIEWLAAGGVTIPFGIQIDALSVLMSLIVTGVGSCIFLYSTGYMKGEDGYSRYFACLSLFAFSMQGIVFSTNLVQTFMFWELVGVSSYSLIGYYFHKPSAVDAGKKAFLTNRIGDFGMTVGILLLFYTLYDASSAIEGISASFTFDDLRAMYQGDAMAALFAEHESTLMWAGLLIFTGAVAKSAQVPLHVWLPDAMEGPTPVSALMHAATMVAAGVYLVCRTYFLFAPFEMALHIIAWMGGITALLAAGLAFVQHDIKKVLAYSTLSQLGYMTLALGVLSPVAAMFHLTTHACFKALLFLGSGSVIHGCHHEQDMRQMGGLMKKMPVTAWTFWIGTLALAGIFPLSGFWSKDAILSAASLENTGSTALLIIGVLVALMTAAYMGRCCWLTFHGEYRGHAKPHESPLSMTVPLMLLAVASVFAGLINFPKAFMGREEGGWLEHAMVGTSEAASYWLEVKPEEFHPWVAFWGTLAALLGLLAAWLFYRKRVVSIDRFVSAIKPVHTLLERKYFFDDAYLWLVREVQQRFARLCDFVEVYILRWLVDTTAALHRWVGAQIRLILDGHLHRYVTVALVGAVLILSYVLVGV